MNRIVPTVIVTASLALTLVGCATSVDSHVACAAYNEDGTVLTPLSYPIGEATVSYRHLNNGGVGFEEETKGIIEKTDLGFRLDVKNLPNFEELTSSYYKSPSVIFIDTPETGSVGFTSGCFSEGVDDNGIPATFVRLLTSSS